MTIKMKLIDGDDTVEFLAFNIDGEGTSLVMLEDGSLTGYSKEDTLTILFGGKGENPKYTLLNIKQ